MAPSAADSLVAFCMTSTMTTYNNDGKTSPSRPPDLEGTEEIHPWAYWYAHRVSLDWMGGVLRVSYASQVRNSWQLFGDAHVPQPPEFCLLMFPDASIVLLDNNKQHNYTSTLNRHGLHEWPCRPRPLASSIDRNCDVLPIDLLLSWNSKNLFWKIVSDAFGPNWDCRKESFPTFIVNLYYTYE